MTAYYTRLRILSAHGVASGPIPAHVERELAAAGVPTRKQRRVTGLTAREQYVRGLEANAGQGRG